MQPAQPAGSAGPGGSGGNRQLKRWGPIVGVVAVVAIGAALDKESRFARLCDWQHVSLADTTVHEIPAAGHFCIHSHRQDYLEQVTQAVARWQST
jgi:surfactin synthase thioesterase subunit